MQIWDYVGFAISQFGLSQIQRPSLNCIIKEEEEEEEEASLEEPTPPNPNYPASQAALEGHHKITTPLPHLLRSGVYPTVMGHHSGRQAPISALWYKYISALRPISPQFRSLHFSLFFFKLKSFL